MRRYRRMIWLGFVVGVLGCLPIQGAGAEDRVRFKWAFGAVVGQGEDQRLVSIVRDTTLKTGEQLRMFVDLHSACFVYVIYRDSDGEVKLLFPPGLNYFKNEARITPYYVPRDTWFRLDSRVGEERFYLLASAERLDELEGLVAAYGAAGEDKKTDLGDGIVAHIRALRREHRPLYAHPERPAAIGGTVRGLEMDIAEFAVEISVPEFYSKTFTIDHRE